MPGRLASLVVLALLSHGQTVTAQCAITSSSNVPQPHLTGAGFCTTVWDPDGTGPLPQRLVVGGSGLLGGAQLSGGASPSLQCVMTWDGTDWRPLGTLAGDPYDGVSSLLSWNGELIAGGNFSNSGGPSYVARWDGSTWQPLGTGLPAMVTSLAAWNGNLVAVGLSSAGGVTTPFVQLWNGVAWTALPWPPLLRAPMEAVSFNGELVVAGSVSPTPPTLGVLERWNGTAWAPSILAQNYIYSLAVHSSLLVGAPQTLYVGGSFTSIGGTAINNLAKTSGGAFNWSSAGGGFTSSIRSLHIRNAGLNYVVAALHGNTPVRYTSSNNTWSQMGTEDLNALTYYAGSYHGVASFVGPPSCHRYDGSAWAPVLGPGIVGDVHAAVQSGDDMVIGGTFPKVSGVTMNCIARWDGTAFTPLGTGMVGSSVDALLTLDNGNVVAGGNFAAAGGTAANGVARWNGTSWFAMGSGMNTSVHALCKMPNGDVIAGGTFTTAGGVACSRIARWNGTAWSAMHTGMNDDVLALAVRDDGTLFAGGRFTIASSAPHNRVARWTGTQWSQLGSGMNGAVHGLAARPGGGIVAVGEFTQASALPVDRIARWNGATWLPMGAASGNPGVVRAVHALPNGDVIAGRGFHQPGATVDSGLSRWNGSTWSAMSSLTGTHTTIPVDVRAIVQRADGDLVLGGHFAVAATTPSHALASLQSDCMPTAASHGAGCSSAAGPLVLSADTLPWIGAAFRTTTTGVAPGSVCLGITGLSPLSLPLGLLIAGGQPGCSLLSTLDIVTVLAPGPGTAHSTFALSNDPALLALPFFQQTIPFEFDLAGAVTAVRGSNALALVIGTL